MSYHHHDIGGSFTASIITAGVALLPDAVMSYGLKVISVFALAAVAELGRRLIDKLWKKK